MAKVSGVDLNIFPNPAWQTVGLQLQNFEKEQVVVKIIDLAGKERKVLNLKQNNTNYHQISIEDLEEATYFIIVYVDDVTTVKQKLIVVK